MEVSVACVYVCVHVGEHIHKQTAVEIKLMGFTSRVFVVVVVVVALVTDCTRVHVGGGGSSHLSHAAAPSSERSPHPISAACSSWAGRQTWQCGERRKRRRGACDEND